MLGKSRWVIIVDTTWRTLREKCPNTEVFSGPYFPVFGLNTEIYSVRMQENTDQKKLRIWTIFTQ